MEWGKVIFCLSSFPLNPPNQTQIKKLYSSIFSYVK